MARTRDAKQKEPILSIVHLLQSLYNNIDFSSIDTNLGTLYKFHFSFFQEDINYFQVIAKKLLNRH